MTTAASTLRPVRTPNFSPAADDELQESVPTSQQPALVMALVAGVALLFVVYGQMLSITSEFWADDQYSHGWLIPLIGLFLMWSVRRPRFEVTPEREKQNWIIVGVPFGLAAASYLIGEQLEMNLTAVTWGLYCVGILTSVWLVFHNHDFEVCADWERWVGVALFTVALLTRVYASQIDMKPLDRLTFLPAALGVFAMVGGWPLVRRMGIAIIFFIFMFPLPSQMEEYLLPRLQNFAAAVSTFILQMMGLGATLIGNKISVDGLRDELEVAEACSGLRMLTIFAAMSIAGLLLVQRPWWDKLVMFLSALPVALATNIIRITVTALLYLAVEGPEPTEFEEWMKHQIHDYAGLAMIFIAMGIMYAEYIILKRLTVADEDDSEDLAGSMLLGKRRAPTT